VPKKGEPNFQKEELARMWEVHGAAFLMGCGHHTNEKWRDSFKLPPEVRAKLYDEFMAVDADQSGALDAAELSKLFNKLGLHVPNEVRLVWSALRSLRWRHTQPWPAAACAALTTPEPALAGPLQPSSQCAAGV
jgi:hypothetical protein